MKCSITECNVVADVYILRPTVREEDDLFRVGRSHEEMKSFHSRKLATFLFVVVSFSCLKSKPQIL